MKKIIITKKLQKADKKININALDSKEHSLIRNSYLPGEILTIVLGKMVSYVVEEIIFDNKLGE